MNENDLPTTSAGLGAGLTIVFSLIGLALLVIHVFVLIDLLKHSDGAWSSAGQNKTLWIVLWVGSWCCGVLWVFDLVYWFAIRPKLQAAGGGTPGGPEGYSGYAP